jgi:aspartate aminotransferase
MAPFMRFLSDSAWTRRDPENPRNCDFVFGNPHDMPLPAFVTALHQWSVPQDKTWFAYKSNEPKSRRIIAASLRERYGTAFESDDIFLTNGAFAALAVALCALVDPGDEVIFISPPYVVCYLK